MVISPSENLAQNVGLLPSFLACCLVQRKGQIRHAKCMASGSHLDSTFQGAALKLCAAAVLGEEAVNFLSLQRAAIGLRAFGSGPNMEAGKGLQTP